MSPITTDAPLLRQQPCRGATDTRRRAGDHGDLSIEIEHVGSPVARTAAGSSNSADSATVTPRRVSVITVKPDKWDRVVDVVVVGSGGAALVAATLAHDGGAEVLVVEKADMIGGTTAVSGGVMWLPGNHLMAAAGIADSRDDAIAYITRLANGHEHDPALIETFVDTAPEMLRYLEAAHAAAHGGRAELPRLLLRLRRPGQAPRRPLASNRCPTPSAPSCPSGATGSSRAAR